MPDARSFSAAPAAPCPQSAPEPEQTETSPGLPSRGRSRGTLVLLAAIREILEEVQPTSVRGVCYQLFSRKLIGSMKKNETSRVGRLLTEAREDGSIPWKWVTDETRKPERVPTWANPAEILKAASQQYRKDYWATQPRRVEVWAEKGTVRGTLRPVLDEFALTFRAFHGFSSATSLNDIASQTADLSRPLIALYVGDWDPSGLAMSEKDLPRRLAKYGANVDFLRVALAEEDLPGLPSFSAETKKKDSRAAKFRRQYGEECYELDAMSPLDLRRKVREAVAECIDWDAWNRCTRAEEAEQESLNKVLAAWNRRQP